MYGRGALWVLLLPTLALAQSAHALNPELALTQYGHRAWLADASANGLPQNSVFSIVQTRDGYLWLATQEGLARFDGMRFTVFNTRNTPGIQHNDVWKLLEDRDGNLWIGTRGGGLTRYRNGVFAHFGRDEGLLSDSIQALWQDRDGSLWIGTTGGLNRFKDGRFTAFTRRDGLSKDTVFCVRGDSAGNLWIGTDNGGLDRLRDGKFTHLTTHDGLSNDTVYALQEDRDGGLWIGTGAGLNYLKDGRLLSYRVRDGLSNDNVRAIYHDRAGSLWIGTDGGGLNRYAHGRFAALAMKQGLSSDSIGAIYEDREGSLWLGTDAGGLNQLKNEKFVGYGALEGLGNENARAVLESADGALWIGTFGGLYRYQDGAFTLFGKKQGLSSEVVLSLAQTRDGDIWAGTLGGGINRLHGGRFTHYGKERGLANDTVLALLEDSRGTLWAGTRSGGLHRFDHDRFRAYTTADGLGSNDIRYLLEGRRGELWIGTRGGGLNRLEDGKFTTFTTKQGLSNDLVFAIHEDREGALWIGTFGGGLDRFKDGRFIAYTTRQGMPDDVVFQILEDRGGDLWLSSNHGVAHVRKQELNDFADGRVPSVSYVAYGAADGMRSAECNGAHQPAGWQTRDGRLWFPTVKGIAVIDPQNIGLNTVPPPVLIENVQLNDRPMAPASELDVPPGRQKLEFQYTALSFLSPERVRFRYRLDGYDEGWVEAGAHRSAHYTNIPPGRYTFRVIAGNNDNVWNEAGPNQSLHLRPFFYQRPIFNLVYVLALLLAAGIGMRLQRGRVRRLQARERELLTLISERKQAEEALKASADELARSNADLEQFAYAASHDLQEPLRTMNSYTQLLKRRIGGQGDTDTDELLDSIVEAVGRQRGLIDGLLAYSRVGHGEERREPASLGTLVDDAVGNLQDAISSSGATVTYEQLPTLRVDRPLIVQLFQNLIGNAVKFRGTHPPAVHIAAERSGPQWHFSVRDNGIGVDPAYAEHIFVPFKRLHAAATYPGSGIGLAQCRKIVERHGGRIWVEAGNPGSVFRFTLPANDASERPRLSTDH